MILVVGGAGFIGSHFIKALRRAGEPVLVFDSLEKGHRAALLGADLVVGDLRQPETIRPAFESRDIDVVVHFAAYIEVGESVQDPLKYFENNVGGTLNLIESMRGHGVGKIVFSSTAAVYGEPESVPITEYHPTRPTNPYGQTKLGIEKALAEAGNAYGLRSVVFRYFNASGADPDGEIGEDHRPETHLIPRILLSALGRAEFKVFGDDYDTSDGTCIRDYVHVSDLADAHLGAVAHLRSGGGSATLNLGNGQGFSVREVVDTVRRVTGKVFQPETAPRRPGDPARLVASSQRAREVLGWTPQYPELETIVHHAWNWYRSHPDGYLE